MSKAWKIRCGLVILCACWLGCAKSDTASEQDTKPKEKTSKANHGRDGWWCDEHGVPEEICALCSSKLAAEFKAKGDWCDEHDRPESQCFTCHPDLQAEFASEYEARYGEPPPAISTDDGDSEHDGSHPHDEHESHS